MSNFFQKAINMVNYDEYIIQINEEKYLDRHFIIGLFHQLHHVHHQKKIIFVYCQMNFIMFVMIVSIIFF